MTIQEAAQAALNQRWKPIAQAKSTKEMVNIYGSTECPMCEAIKEEGLHCIDCLLDEDEPTTCCGNNYGAWRIAIHRTDGLSVALIAAEAVCEQLRGITRGDSK